MYRDQVREKEPCTLGNAIEPAALERKDNDSAKQILEDSFFSHYRYPPYQGPGYIYPSVEMKKRRPLGWLVLGVALAVVILLASLWIGGLYQLPLERRTKENDWKQSPHGQQALFKEKENFLHGMKSDEV